MTRGTSQPVSATTDSSIAPYEPDFAVDASRACLVSTGRYIVTLATSPDTRGGVAAVINSYAQAGLFERWPTIHIVTHSDGGWLKKLRVATMALMRFSALILARRVALVHVHSASNASFWRKSVFMALAFVARQPVIFHLHGGGFVDFYERDTSIVGRWLIRTILRQVDQIVVLTMEWSRRIAKITSNKNVRVIANSVQVPERTMPDAQRPASNVILFLGRLDREKGVLDLIDAMPPICSKVRNVILQFAGEGDVELICARAAECGVSTHVEFLGWVNGNDKVRVLTDATVLALPSYVEGMPMGLLEAMAIGLPVVATRVGGTPDVVEDRITGLLIEPGDSRALVDSLLELLVDPALRTRIGTAARRKILEFYAPWRVMPKVEALYVELLRGSTGTADTQDRIWAQRER